MNSSHSVSGRASVTVSSLACLGLMVGLGAAAPSQAAVVSSSSADTGRAVLLRTSNLGAPGARVQSATETNDSITAIEEAPGYVDLGRAIVDFQYPSEPGRFNASTAQGVLDFRETAAGADGLFQLGSSSTIVGSEPPVAQGSQPVVGTTYVIEQRGHAIATGGAQAPLGAGLATTTFVPTLAAPASQQWSVVDAGGGSLQLINQADGTCLSYADAGDFEQGNPFIKVVGADVCSRTGSVEWRTEVTRDYVDDRFVESTSLRPTANQEFIVVAGGLGDDQGDGPLRFEYADFGQSWVFHAVDKPGGSVPTWSAVRTDGLVKNQTAAPYDLTVGDLDQSVGADGQFHDEAFVVYADGNDNLQLGVVDYNANPSRLLFTPPAAEVTQAYARGSVGLYQEEMWYPGDVIAEAGDFDGDGLQEIAVLVQGADTGFNLSFFRYVAHQDGTRSLDLLSPGLNQVAQPFSATWNVSLRAGHSDSAVGDFDGDGRDDLAIGFASSPDGGPDTVVNLGVATFNTDRSLRSDEVTRPAMNNGQLPPALIDDPARTGSGIELEAGLFRNDAANGFTEQRRQLAIGWVGYRSEPIGIRTRDTQYSLTPEFQLYSVADQSCNPAGTRCTTTTDALGGDADPSLVFPTTKSARWVVSGTEPYDAFPLTFEAGAYGGSAATDPPVWGIVASIYEQLYNTDAGPSTPVRTFRQSTSLIVPWTSTGPAAWTITDTSLLGQDSTYYQERYTAYDPDTLADGLEENAPEQAPQPSLTAPAAVTVAASASPAAVTGRRMTIKGTVRSDPAGASAGTVTLQRRTAAGWADVAGRTTTTQPDGDFTFVVRHRKTGAYTYRVLTGATAERPSAYSPVVKVRVRRPFTVTASAPARVLPGRPVTIDGRVGPVPPDGSSRTVRLQVKTPTGWRHVSTARIQSNGSYAVSVDPGQSGVFRYRVKKVATDSRPSSSSPGVVVTVLAG